MTHTPDRRHQAAQRAILGGRRASDPILDLETETRPFVTLTMLATYFMVDRRFLVECAKAGVLTVHALKGSEWRVKTVHARAFERSQIHPAPTSLRRAKSACTR